MPKVRSIVFSFVLLVGSMVLSRGVGEGVLRTKHSSMRNYDIEMWRYAKDLFAATILRLRDTPQADRHHPGKWHRPTIGT